jgi:protein SCO1
MSLSLATVMTMRPSLSHSLSQPLSLSLSPSLVIPCGVSFIRRSNSSSFVRSFSVLSTLQFRSFSSPSAPPSSPTSSSPPSSSPSSSPSPPADSTSGASDPGARGIRPVSWFSLGLISLASGLALLYYRLASDRVTRSAAKSEVTSVGRASIGGPFELVDNNGKTIKSSDLHGKYSIIYFGFTHCPDVCPTELKKLESALESLTSSPAAGPWIKGRALLPIFISIDPRRDTPTRLSEYSRTYGHLTDQFGMVWLTGSDPAIRSVARAYRVYYSAPEVKEGSDQDYLVDHSIFFYLVDRQGEVLDYMGKNLSAQEMADKIETAIQNDVRLG